MAAVPGPSPSPSPVPDPSPGFSTTTSSAAPATTTTPGPSPPSNAGMKAVKKKVLKTKFEISGLTLQEVNDNKNDIQAGIASAAGITFADVNILLIREIDGR